MYDKIKCGDIFLYFDYTGKIIGYYDEDVDIFYIRSAYKKRFPSMYRYLKNIQGYDISIVRDITDIKV